LKVRYPSITITASDIHGKPFVATLTKRDAVSSQHEYDHIFGKTLFDSMRPMKKRMAIKRCLNVIKRAQKRK
jgi:peptide deformylase